MYCFIRSIFLGGVSLLGLALLGGCSVSGNNVSLNPDVMDSDLVVMKHGWTPGFERHVNAMVRPSQARFEPKLPDPAPDEASTMRNWQGAAYLYPSGSVVAFPTYNPNYEDRPAWLQNDNFYALLQPLVVVADVLAAPFWMLVEPPSTQVAYRGTRYGPSMTVAPPLPNN